MLEEIAESDLLAAVENAGEAPPSSDQLRSWRRAGLMPRPRVVHAKGLKGSQAWYPAWAAEHLVALVRLHRDTHRLRDLCITLWWEGHWVEPEKLRSALVAPLERMSNEATTASADAENPYEVADVLLSAIQADGTSSGALGVFRERLRNRADFSDLLWTLLAIAAGGKAPWEEEDRSRPDPAPGALPLLAKAFGVDQAMSDNPLGNGPWLPATFDLRTFMAELRDMGGFELTDAARVVREASYDQLEQARKDALLFAQPLAMIFSTIEGLLGREIPALRAIRTMTCATSIDRAIMVRSMLILRAHTGDETFLEIERLVEQVHDRFDAITQLRAALPQHETILRLGFAHQLAALPPSEAEQVQEDVSAFLAQHPQIASALSSEARPEA